MASEQGLTHFDSSGASRMVDVSAKPATDRYARAACVVRMRSETLRLVIDRTASKGDVAEVARLAGILAAKKTGDLIPLCHPLPLTSVALSIEPRVTPPSERAGRERAAGDVGQAELHIEAEVRTTGPTGVEMEALTAVSVAGLTVYDMLKAVDREIEITDIRLLEKRGGKSGDYRWPT